MLTQTSTSKQITKYTQLLLVSVVVILLVRLVISALLPYMDTTEARYGEISRLIAEKNCWVMPWFNAAGDPFWAKPPLSFWLSAISFNVFGVNEFAGRFPTFILSLITILFVGRWALKMKKFELLFFAFVILTMPVFLMHLSIVSTDTAFNLAVAIIMLSFWKAINSSSKNYWGYLIFVGLGIGLMARGPLTIVFVGPPLFVWVWQQKRWKDLWRRIPWLLGSCIMLVIAVPWYLMAEHESPGFLDYFIIGEHFRRYVDPGYTQDLYGNSHPHPLGTMWIYITEYMAPWILYVYYKLVCTRKHLLQDSWIMFLVFWLFWIPVFFSLSKNTMYTYMLSCTVPCALLVSHWMSFETIKKWFMGMSVIVVLLVVATVLFVVYFQEIKYRINTDKFLVEQYDEYKIQHPEQANIPYVTWGMFSFSSQFYTKGKVHNAVSEGKIKEYIKQGQPFFIEFKNKTAIPPFLTPYGGKLKTLYSNYKHHVCLFTPE